jgi:hypothetical protein
MARPPRWSSISTMTFPTVVELPPRLEPLTRDTFVVTVARVRDAAPAVRRIVD